MKNREDRTYRFERVVFRSENGQGTFVGHAAVFNQKTEIGDLFTEQIAPEAFDRALEEEHDVRLLVDHEPSKLLARTESGTLRLARDKIGLKTEADIAPTSVGNDVRILLERGDLSAMSFGFIVRKDSWEDNLRTILDVDLLDVSVVTFPAYPQTEAALRSRSSWEAKTAKDRWAEAQKRFEALPQVLPEVR